MSDWQEIGGDSGDMWNREGSIEGILVSRQSNVGPNDSMKYNLKTAKGEMGVWGSTVLDSKLEQVTNGSEIRITYLGKASSKGGRGEYHDFKVEVKPAEDTINVDADVKKVQDTLGGEII